MNYHYIEYMLQEQLKDEIAACHKRRLLKAEGKPEESAAWTTGLTRCWVSFRDWLHEHRASAGTWVRGYLHH